MKVVAALAATALFAVPASAHAAVNRDTKIYKDCQDDGWLSGHYTKAQLRHAIKHMPTDVAEYSNCEARLKRVLKHGGDGRTNGRGGVKAVVRDASDGVLDHHWSVTLLRRAEKPATKKGRKVIRAELRKRRR